jgi:hypothetical protein
LHAAAGAAVVVVGAGWAKAGAETNKTLAKAKNEIIFIPIPLVSQRIAIHRIRRMAARAAIALRKKSVEERYLVGRQSGDAVRSASTGRHLSCPV